MCTKRKKVAYLLLKETILPGLCLRTVYKKMKSTVLLGDLDKWGRLHFVFFEEQEEYGEPFFPPLASIPRWPQGSNSPGHAPDPLWNPTPGEDTGMNELNLYQWNNMSYLGAHLQRLIFFSIFPT